MNQTAKKKMEIIKREGSSVVKGARCQVHDWNSKIVEVKNQLL